MKVYGFLKSVYKKVVPAKVQRMTWDPDYPFHHVISPLKQMLPHKAGHDEIYDAYYFNETMEPFAKKSAEVIAGTIRRAFHPSSVVDIGCGTGELLLALRRLDIEGVGLEYSSAALEIARSKGVDVRSHNLEQPLDRQATYRADVRISTEVAEHLDANYADPFVDFLCRTSDTVVMTAAEPGQGGPTTSTSSRKPTGSRNSRSAASLSIASCRRVQRRVAYAEIADFYYNNLMIFRRAVPAGATPASATEPRLPARPGDGR